MVQNKQFKSIYGFIRLNMKTVLIIWVVAVVYCILEGIFFSELDPESKKELKNRQNERKNNNLYK